VQNCERGKQPDVDGKCAVHVTKLTVYLLRLLFKVLHHVGECIHVIGERCFVLSGKLIHRAAIVGDHLFYIHSLLFCKRLVETLSLAVVSGRRSRGGILRRSIPHVFHEVGHVVGGRGFCGVSKYRIRKG